MREYIQGINFLEQCATVIEKLARCKGSSCLGELQALIEWKNETANNGPENVRELSLAHRARSVNSDNSDNLFDSDDDDGPENVCELSLAHRARSVNSNNDDNLFDSDSDDDV